MTESNRKPIGMPPRRKADNVSVQNLVKANRSPGTTQGKPERSLSDIDFWPVA